VHLRWRPYFLACVPLPNRAAHERGYALATIILKQHRAGIGCGVITPARAPPQFVPFKVPSRGASNLVTKTSGCWTAAPRSG